MRQETKREKLEVALEVRYSFSGSWANRDLTPRQRRRLAKALTERILGMLEKNNFTFAVYCLYFGLDNSKRPKMYYYKSVFFRHIATGRTIRLVLQDDPGIWELEIRQFLDGVKAHG